MSSTSLKLDSSQDVLIMQLVCFVQGPLTKQQSNNGNLQNDYDRVGSYRQKNSVAAAHIDSHDYQYIVSKPAVVCLLNTGAIGKTKQQSNNGNLQNDHGCHSLLEPYAPSARL